MEEIKRRSLLKALGLTAAASLTGSLAASASSITQSVILKGEKPVLVIAHITDVHIRDGDSAPERFQTCLKQILVKHKPDFFLNGGDSIHDASYDKVIRDQVTQQWAIWDKCIQTIADYEIYSCIGNHDTWWNAPKEDEMFGKDYAVKRLKIPKRYYSFTKNNWHFIILDGNNDKISLDDEQFSWLEQELQKQPGLPTLLMSHYPILGTTQVLVGGGHSDCKKLKDLFHKHGNKVKICLSGHNHLADHTEYNRVQYCCNGAMSGFWWGKGDAESAGPGYYMETPPGYAILKMYADGTVENEYHPHQF